jgi:hypothetical protein
MQIVCAREIRQSKSQLRLDSIYFFLEVSSASNSFQIPHTANAGKTIGAAAVATAPAVASAAVPAALAVATPVATAPVATLELNPIAVAPKATIGAAVLTSLSGLPVNEGSMVLNSAWLIRGIKSVHAQRERNRIKPYLVFHIFTKDETG